MFFAAVVFLLFFFARKKKKTSVQLFWKTLSKTKNKKKNGSGECRRSGELFSDALAGSAHLASELHHLLDGLLAAVALVVKQAAVLLREPVK